MSKSLERRPDAEVAELVRKNELAVIVGRVADQDATLVEQTHGAKRLLNRTEGERLYALSDADLAAHGWTREELIVAIHAVTPGKDMPGYLKLANDRYLLRHRGQEGDTGKKPARAIMFIPRRAPRTEEEERQARAIDVLEAAANALAGGTEEK